MSWSEVLPSLGRVCPVAFQHEFENNTQLEIHVSLLLRQGHGKVIPNQGWSVNMSSPWGLPTDTELSPWSILIYNGAVRDCLPQVHNLASWWPPGQSGSLVLLERCCWCEIPSRWGGPAVQIHQKMLSQMIPKDKSWAKSGCGAAVIPWQWCLLFLASIFQYLCW